MLEQATFEQVLDFANRANPYPLYARLRQTPVARQADGSYVVSTYREIVALLNDPRVSSELRQGKGEDGAGPDQGPDPSRLPGFIRFDPPEHDRLRRQATWAYGPPHTPGRVADMEPVIVRLANRQIDVLPGKTRIELVEDFAYPLPVTVICELLGVPRNDEPRFHVWTEAIAAGTAGADDPQASPQERRRRRDESAQAIAELRQYIAALTEHDRQQPGSDLLSGLVTEHGSDGLMAPADVVDTGTLLLFAGHETTVNLITNGMLTLLRHPDVLERLRREPDLIIRPVHGWQRYEPPVHPLASPTALADIPIADTTIPRGSPVILLLASGN